VIGAAVDLLVAALLIATCVYCAILSRRLNTVREGQAALEAAIATFDDASRQAKDNLDRMERNGDAMGRGLTKTLARGDALASELAVMINAGDRIAGRIESAVGSYQESRVP